MGITSAAEAKLDARIRPEITVLRSVTSYPRRHRPALVVIPGGREADGRAGSDDAVAAQVTAPATAVADRESARVRLTRRGKIVVGLLAAIAVAAVAALVWLAVEGRAQAAGQAPHARPPGHSMLRVVVRPGESLWSIAVRSDPAADPRVVIQQIIDENALRGTAIRAGQVLWVPRI
jgi:hypothetical protein